MAEKLDLTYSEFVTKMMDFAKNYIKSEGAAAQSCLGPRRKQIVLTRRNCLSNSLLYASLYKIDEIPLNHEKRYLDVLAYFAF